MNLKETLEILESENQPLFAFKIRVGEIANGAFDPQQSIKVVGNSTQEFVDNLKTSLLNLPGRPELSKKSEHELYDKLSDMELNQKSWEREALRAKEDEERKYNE